MPRTPSNIVVVSRVSQDGTAPKTPVRSRMSMLPTPFSKRKPASPTTTSISASSSTPIKAAFPTTATRRTSGEEAYPTPEKDYAHGSTTGKENKPGVSTRARDRLASLLSRPKLDKTASTATVTAQNQEIRDDKKALHLSPAASELVDTIRSIRARSISNASMDSVKTVRHDDAPASPSPMYQNKRERADSAASSRTINAPAQPVTRRKRERTDSTVSVDSAAQEGRESARPVKGQPKRQRLSSATSGVPAAVLAARAIVETAQARKALSGHRKSTDESMDEDDDEDEVRQILSVADEEWGSSEENSSSLPSRRSTSRASRTLGRAPGLPRAESTCALIIPALATARLSSANADDESFFEDISIDDIPDMESGPDSPVLGQNLQAELATSTKEEQVGNTEAEDSQYQFFISISHAAFWDISPTSTTPLLITGELLLSDPSPSFRYPPDVNMNLNCFVSPVQRGLGRGALAPVQDDTVEVTWDRAWDRRRPGWRTNVHICVPPSLFLGAETRALTLQVQGDMLLPCGAGFEPINTSATISVSALSTPRELALSSADRECMEGLARERTDRAARAAKEALYRQMIHRERTRLLEQEMHNMTEDEQREYLAWLATQEEEEQDEEQDEDEVF